MEQYCLVPGEVENWTIVIDTKEEGVSQYPDELVEGIVDFCASNYPCSIDKFLIIKATFILKTKIRISSSIVL
jgi:uncharacterized iron-regulated protein